MGVGSVGLPDFGESPVVGLLVSRFGWAFDGSCIVDVLVFFVGLGVLHGGYLDLCLAGCLWV